MNEATRQGRIRNILGRLEKGFTKEVGFGREDQRQSLKRTYAEQGKETDGSRVDQTMGTNRTITMARELLGKADPDQVANRNAMGIGLSDDPVERIGQMGGAIAGDIVQDRGRSVWWLLNAPQAVGNVLQEMMLHKHAPGIFKADPVLLNGVPVTTKMKNAASQLGLVDKEGRTTKGVTIQGGEYRKRRHEPGHTEALMIPAGLAVNTAIGLMNPFGGAEGYKAVLPSDEDPTKTSNVIGEVAAKYLLGRTGQLLPWDEFKQVRPDVSKDEYMRYKAFKFDNEGDINPFDDGQVALPTGVLKYTQEGIHGPEVQFLGKSLPVATGLLPTATALVGTTYGARRGGVKGGLGYGSAATAGGMVLGNIIEGIRRNRNAEENKTDTIGM